MASKRSLGSASSGDTPGKSKSKVPFKASEHSDQQKSRKSLFQTKEVVKAKQKVTWSTKECQALVQYICLYWKDAWSNKWPSTKDEGFWSKCAEAVNNACNSNRTGSSCRTRVLKKLAKEYSTLKEAEEGLSIDYIHDPIDFAPQEPQNATP